MLRFTAAGPRDSLYRIQYDTLRDAGLGCGSRAHGRLMGVSGARAAGPRVRDGMVGLRGARRGGGFAGARWRLPSRRVGLSPGEGCPMECLVTIECSPASAWQLSQGARRTPLAGVGLPKQLGHARPRAHMLAEARFPRRYPGRVLACSRLERRPFGRASARCQATLSAPSRAPGLTRLAMAQRSS